MLKVIRATRKSMLKGIQATRKSMLQFQGPIVLSGLKWRKNKQKCYFEKGLFKYHIITQRGEELSQSITIDYNLQQFHCYSHSQNCSYRVLLKSPPRKKAAKGRKNIINAIDGQGLAHNYVGQIQGQTNFKSTFFMHKIILETLNSVMSLQQVWMV